MKYPKPRKMMTERERIEWRMAAHTVRGSGCWLWSGGKSGGGYGVISRTSLFPDSPRSPYAHQMAWALAHNTWPPENHVVRHRCNTPLCVNPAHLVLGTQKQNMDDRASVGHHITTQRLTEAQVKHILTSEESQSMLASMYGVSQVTISNVRRRKVYKWVIL